MVITKAPAVVFKFSFGWDTVNNWMTLYVLGRAVKTIPVAVEPEVCPPGTEDPSWNPYSFTDAMDY